MLENECNDSIQTVNDLVEKCEVMESRLRATRQSIMIRHFHNLDEGEQRKVCALFSNSSKKTVSQISKELFPLRFKRLPTGKSKGLKQ